MVQLVVRGGSACRLVEVGADSTVSVARARIACVEGVHPDVLRLSSAGVSLDDNQLVSQLSADIDINVNLDGGKVHGSLARAGKVKGQTPKVEKQGEKRKAKVGRAKRREQHRKRFVIHVINYGKKRGPNSNS